MEVIPFCTHKMLGLIAMTWQAGSPTWQSIHGSEVIACWIPVSPIPLSLGGLVICRASNSHPGARGCQTWGIFLLESLGK